MNPFPRQTLKSLGASSAKYGACEACHAHVSDVHMLVVRDSRGREVLDLFGHRDCLANRAAEVRS